MPMDTKTILTEVKFVSKIAKMGKNKKHIAIPKDFWEQIETLEGKQILVTVKEAYE